MAIVVNRSVTSGEGNIKAEMLDMFYPVGSYYYTSDTNFDPNTAWGGTWVEDTPGRVLVGQDSGTFSTVGDTGGEETHTLIISEMPRHTHGSGGPRWNTAAGANAFYGSNGTGDGSEYDTNWYTGGDAAHNNLQPYIVVKIWHRTA